MREETDFYRFNTEKIQRFLQKYGEATNVYIASYDRYGSAITGFCADEAEKEELHRLITDTMIVDVLDRVTGNGLEDQVIEDTPYPFLKIAASALKIGGKSKIIWFFAGVIKDRIPDEMNSDEAFSTLKRRIDFSNFIKTTDILRDIGQDRLKDRMSIAKTQEESLKSRFSANEMAGSLRRIESLTKILKYLDSDKPIESIMQDFLEITSSYLGVGTSDILKVRADDDAAMDVAVQWCAESVLPIFDHTLNQKRPSFLKGEKPVILSSDSAFITNFLTEDTQIKAVVAMPVTLGKVTNMYACYFELQDSRTWKIEEMQFLSDAIRVLQNILEKRIQKNSLASSYASLEEILEHIGCAIIVRDPASGNILFENKLMKEVFAEDSMHVELDEVLKDTQSDQNETEFYDHIREHWYEVHRNMITWVDGRPMGLFAVYDVTDKRRYQRKIEQQAYTDFLTGLYNRLCCERDLARIIDEARKFGETGALLYLDLDDFKHINDGLGHQYGDVLLKSISHSLRCIEGIENTCYRMGGDEFVIIIPPKSYAAFEHIIENIRNVFAKPWFLKDADYYCTTSMGIVTFPEEGESVEDLIKKADIAMYEAKKSGKNRVATYNSENLVNSNRRLDMEKNMRDATANGYEEFEIYYQPIIDIQKKGTPCTGAEALIRWNNAELGFISPADFIPLAEYLGLINPIGNYVLKQACLSCKHWNESGYPSYKVNVNLSVVQLLQNNISEIIEDTITETGINPRNLTLEVTESLAINDMERMKEIMTHIRQLGVRIALDDFGTGYSSLNHIREIPLDVIKVDQSFVRDLVADDYSKYFIKMVAELAGAIGVTICVEGIESREQYKVLEGMKVRLVQGYYFDRPMPQKEFEEKYISKNIKKEKTAAKLAAHGGKAENDTR